MCLSATARVPLAVLCHPFFFFFSSRRRHTRSLCDWSSDVCSSDLGAEIVESLDDETAAETLEEMAAERQAQIIGDMDEERAADILEHMSPDEAADVQIGRASCRERV